MQKSHWKPKQNLFFNVFVEASSLDRINMTKSRLEFDQKILTTTNVMAGT